MRCSDLLLLQLLLWATLCFLLVQARSIKEEELQPHALSEKENGSGDQVTSTTPKKVNNSNEPAKVTLKESKKKFDPDDKETKRKQKKKANARSKRRAVRRQKGQPLGQPLGRKFGNDFDGVRMPPFAGVGDLSSQIRGIIAQYSAKHAEEQGHSDVGSVVAALSDAIRGSQQRVEDQVMVLTEENNAQLAAVVAAVNQSADSLASLAETAEETHEFLQTIAQSLSSIKAMMQQYLQGVPLIGTVLKPLENTTATSPGNDTCTGYWERIGSDCVHISIRSPQPHNKLNWYNAREMCQSEGGDLLEPSDVYILYNYLMENNLMYGYWLGGSNLNDQTDWEWVSGRPIVSAWSALPRQSLNCLNFSSNENLPLSAGDCDDESYYLCQKHTVLYAPTRSSNVSEESVLNVTTQKPTWYFSVKWSTANVTDSPLLQGLCEEPYLKVGSECFHVLEEASYTWKEARSYCQDEGSDLAEPESLENLRQYLRDEFLHYSDYWLGGSYKEEEKKWLWLSGRTVSENWMAGQPSGEEDANCLDFQPDNSPSLNDYTCSQTQGFICEKPMEWPIDGGSLALEADSFIELLQGILTHPELALINNETLTSKNETRPSKNETDTSDSSNEVNLSQFLNLLKPIEESTEAPETSDSIDNLNGLSELLNLFKPAEESTETPGDAFTNNINELLQAFTQMIHGAISEAAGWCGPPLKLVGNECFFISDSLVDVENAAVKPEMTWSDAQEFCRENGGDLAEPRDLQALREILTPDVKYWVGSKYEELENMWKWVSGEETATHNISTDFNLNNQYCLEVFSTGNFSQHCLQVYEMSTSVAETLPAYLQPPPLITRNQERLTNGSVYACAYKCENSQRWVCEKLNPHMASSNETATDELTSPDPTTENPSLSSDFCSAPFEVVGSQCLYVGEHETTWYEAEERCQNMNGNLAEITDDQNTVIDFLSSKGGGWSWAWIARTSVRNTNQWLRSQMPIPGHWVEVPDNTYKGCLKLGVEYGGFKPYDCKNSGGHYICERKVNSSVSSNEEETRPSYMLVGSELFLIRNEKLSWSKAETACKELDGYLAEPRNLTALRSYMLENNYDDDYWIGGSDQDKEGSWLWTESGLPITDNWMEDQPGGDKSQNCLDFQPQELPSLNDYSCGVTQNYICEKDYQPSGSTESTVIRETGLGNYTQIGTEWFMVVKQKKSWSDAREYCKQNGGDLASPKNLEALKDYLKEENEEHDYWLGGTDEAKEDTWVWLNGESIADSWKAGQPSGGRRQNCLDFRSEFFPSLNDYECDESQYFICESESTTVSSVKHEGLHVSGIEVPKHLVVGQNATLKCHVNLDGNTLYSLKWLKDGEQFYEFMPKNEPSAVPFTVEGITVNLAKSGLHEVELLDLQINSSGEYRCEVTGESPAFIRHQFSANMTVIDCNEPYFQVGNECFLVVEEKKSWFSARDYCQDQGDILAVPINQDELTNYLREKRLMRDYWLGATDEAEEGIWISVTGDPFKWPNNFEVPINRIGNCLDFRTDRTPSYHGYVCTNEQYFICEHVLSTIITKNATPIPESSCEDPYVMIGSECFNIVHNRSKSWHDAREDCQDNGGDLAIPIDVILLQNYLNENDMVDDYWLGGSDVDEEGSWFWLTGEEITAGWDEGEPNFDNTENCLDFRTDAVLPLHDYYCTTLQNYICEKPISSTPDRNQTETEPTSPSPDRNQTETDNKRCDEEFQFTCNANKQYGRPECIPKEWVCDGEPDCADGADENKNSTHHNCPDLPDCGEHEFKCNNGQCINKNWKCDTDNDCGDGSDEGQECDKETHECNSYEFTCNNAKCILKSYWCDGEDDCGDNSDEIKCVPEIPKNVQAIGFNNGSLSITWDKPVESSGFVKEYQVKLVQGKEHSILYQSTTNLVTRFDDLIPGSTYNVSVSAINAEGYGNSTKIISVTIPTESCEEPFFTAGDSCYQKMQGRYNWYQARQLCQEQDADLLQAHSFKFIQNFLSNDVHSSFRNNDYVSRTFWMGASDEGKEGSWRWVSGEPVFSDAWDGDRQAGANSYRNCMNLRYSKTADNYNWTLVSDYCDYNKEVICEKQLTHRNNKTFYTQVGSEYFFVFNESMEWNRAQGICQAIGGDLAQPKDLDLLRNWIYDNKFSNSSSFWLGASDIEREGNWFWLNGSNVEHGWMKGEPDNRDYDENCLLFMASYDPSMNDWKCDRSHNFICELNKDENNSLFPLRDEQDPFFTLGDEKFLVIEEWKTWEEALNSCNTYGGYLAEPKDFELLKSHLRDHEQIDADYWIGGSDSENEGSWKWLNGTNVNTSLWMNGDPDGLKAENCLDFQPQEDPPLNDYDCEETQYYICEKSVEKTNLFSDEGCNSPFVQLGSECLLIIKDVLWSWQKARNYCQRNNADLAILDDITRLRKYFLRNDIEYNFWVGGSKLNSDKEWLWLNGDPFTGEWRDGEPTDNMESKCLLFHSGYRKSYNAYECSGEQSFICEKPTIGGKSVYDNKIKHPNYDLSSNFDKTSTIVHNIEETTEELVTTILPDEVTDFFG